MKMSRIYRLTAMHDQVEALHDALDALRSKLCLRDGCESITLYQNVSCAAQFVFIEQWKSAEASSLAARELGKDAFRQVLAALASAPDTAEFEILEQSLVEKSEKHATCSII